MNPLQFLKTIRDPKKAVMSMLGQNTNPIIQNMVKLANEGKTKEVENIARNLYKEQGKDFNKEMQNFMSNFR